MKKIWLLGLLAAVSPVVADGQRVDLFNFDLSNGEKLMHMVTHTEDPKRPWNTVHWIDAQGGRDSVFHQRVSAPAYSWDLVAKLKIMAASAEKDRLRVVIDWQMPLLVTEGVVTVPKPAMGKHLGVWNVIRHHAGNCEMQAGTMLRFLGYHQTLAMARERYGSSSEGRFSITPRVAVLSHALGELREIRFQNINTIQCLWRDGTHDTVILNADGEVAKVINAPELMPERDD